MMSMEMMCALEAQPSTCLPITIPPVDLPD